MTTDTQRLIQAIGLTIIMWIGAFNAGAPVHFHEFEFFAVGFISVFASAYLSVIFVAAMDLIFKTYINDTDKFHIAIETIGLSLFFGLIPWVFIWCAHLYANFIPDFHFIPWLLSTLGM